MLKEEKKRDIRDSDIKGYNLMFYRCPNFSNLLLADIAKLKALDIEDKDG